MKTQTFLSLAAALAVPLSAFAQKGNWTFPNPGNTNPPPSDYVVDPPPPPLSTYGNPAPQYSYDQKPMGGHPYLITPDQAQTIISGFKTAYPGLGSPRFLLYINRELVDQQSGMKLAQRTERVDSRAKPGDTNAPAVKSDVKNVYSASDKPQPTTTERQNARDIERLFGRPLRDAGAVLVDQKVAAQLIADRPLEDFVGTADTPQARKDREALTKSADAVIEILMSSRDVSVPTISGNQTISVPEIQATAISLKDSKIIGQAASSEVTSRVPPASLGQYDLREITEATALALMEDMTPHP